MVPAIARPPIRDEIPKAVSNNNTMAMPMKSGPLLGAFSNAFDFLGFGGFGVFFAGSVEAPAETLDMTSLTNPSLRLGGFGRDDGLGGSLPF
jgi:hypothetical protein